MCVECRRASGTCRNLSTVPLPFVSTLCPYAISLVCRKPGHILKQVGSSPNAGNAECRCYATEQRHQSLAMVFLYQSGCHAVSTESQATLFSVNDAQKTMASVSAMVLAYRFAVQVGCVRRCRVLDSRPL